jgi:hypothetical protein
MNTTLELTPEQKACLGEQLEHELWKLREEIFRTDSLRFKEMLRKKETVLEELNRKVESMDEDQTDTERFNLAPRFNFPFVN